MPPDHSTSLDATRVVVPLRSFADAKRRLATHLDAPSRARLVRQLAEGVVAATHPHRVTIVSGADDVVDWARNNGHDVCVDDSGLNDAVHAGIEDAATRGASRVVIAHGDLPLARSFESVLSAPIDDVVIVSDRHGDGTPVIVVPTQATFRPSYGPGSFRRNCDAAVAAGLQLNIVDDESLAFDVDLPEDLEEMRRLARK